MLFPKVVQTLEIQNWQQLKLRMSHSPIDCRKDSDRLKNEAVLREEEDSWYRVVVTEMSENLQLHDDRSGPPTRQVWIYG